LKNSNNEWNKDFSTAPKDGTVILVWITAEKSPMLLSFQEDVYDGDIGEWWIYLGNDLYTAVNIEKYPKDLQWKYIEPPTE
jgi:hypothetical protein